MGRHSAPKNWELPEGASRSPFDANSDDPNISLESLHEYPVMGSSLQEATPEIRITETIPAHVSKPKSRKGLKLTGAVLATTLVLGGGTAAGMYWNLNNRIQSKAVDITETTAQTPAKVAAPKVIEEKVTVDEFQGAYTVLIVGNDDDNGKRDHALNDVNMLLHVSEDHTKATAISVPRDMFVNAPECTNPETGVVNPATSGVKINTSLSRGGLKCVVDTFRQMTGQEIDYAAMIQFDGVIAMSNAVGGVPVCVSTGIDDPKAKLKLAAGQHTLTGDNALAFLRTRHGVGDGSDLARISNQQVFLSSLMKTLKSKETLSDPKKVYGIANAVADNMTLSSNLASIPTLASLAYSLKDIPLEDITFLQYPTAYGSVNGTQGVIPKTEAAASMVEAVFSDKKVTITGGTAPGSIGALEQEETSGADTSKTAKTVDKESKESKESKGNKAVIEKAEKDSTKSSSSTKIVKKTEDAVALSSDVTGMTASQNTCSRGQG